MVGIYRPTGISGHASPQNGKIVQKWVFDRASNRFIPVKKKIVEADVAEIAPSNALSSDKQEDDRLNLLKKELIRLEEQKLQAEIRLLELRVQKGKKKSKLQQVSSNSSAQPKSNHLEVEKIHAPAIPVPPVATRSSSEERRTSPVRRVIRKTHESPTKKKLLPSSPLKASQSLKTTTSISDNKSASRPGAESNSERPPASQSTTKAWSPTKTAREKQHSPLPRSSEVNNSTNKHVSDDDSDSDSSEDVPSRRPQHEQKQRPESKSDMILVRNRTIPPTFEDYTAHNNLSLDSSSSSSSSDSSSAEVRRPTTTESFKGAAVPFSFRRVDNEEMLPESAHSRNLGHHNRRTIKQESLDEKQNAVGGTETSTNVVVNSKDVSINNSVDSASFPDRKSDSKLHSKARPSVQSSRRPHQQAGDSGDSSIDSSFDPRHAVQRSGQILLPLLNQASDSVNVDAASNISDASGGPNYRYTPTKYSTKNNPAALNKGAALETSASISEGSMSAVTHSDSSDIQQSEYIGGNESGKKEASRLENLRSKRNRQRKQIEERFEKMLPDNKYDVHSDQGQKPLPKNKNGTAFSYADGSPGSLIDGAYQVNMATAVLVYLKQINMNETARKFQREWRDIHGNLPLAHPTIMGTIRFEPLLREDSFSSSDSHSSTASAERDASSDDHIDEAEELSTIVQKPEHRRSDDDSYSAERFAIAVTSEEKVDKNSFMGDGMYATEEMEGGESDAQLYIPRQYESSMELSVGYLGDSEYHRSEGVMERSTVRSDAAQVESESKAHVAAPEDDMVGEDQRPEQTVTEIEPAIAKELLGEAGAEDVSDNKVQPIVSKTDAVETSMNFACGADALNTDDAHNVTQHATDAETETKIVLTVSEEETDKFCGSGTARDKESSSMEDDAETTPDENVFSDQASLDVDDPVKQQPFKESNAETKSEKQSHFSEAHFGSELDKPDEEKPVEDFKTPIEKEDQASQYIEQPAKQPNGETGKHSEQEGTSSKFETGSDPIEDSPGENESPASKTKSPLGDPESATKNKVEIARSGDVAASAPQVVRVTATSSKFETGSDPNEDSTGENESPASKTLPPLRDPESEIENKVEIARSEGIAASAPQVVRLKDGDHARVAVAIDAEGNKGMVAVDAVALDNSDDSPSKTNDVLSDNDANLVIADIPSTNISTACLVEDAIPPASAPTTCPDDEPPPILVDPSPQGDDNQSVVSDCSDYVTLVLDNPELDLSEISISDPLEELVISSKALKAMQNVEKMSYIREESAEADTDTNIEEKVITKPITDESSSEEESSDDEEESSEEETSEEEESSSGEEESSSGVEESSSGVEETSSEAEETSSEEEESSSGAEETTEADDSQSEVVFLIPLPTPKATVPVPSSDGNVRQPPTSKAEVLSSEQIRTSKQAESEKKPLPQVFRDQESESASTNKNADEISHSAASIKRSNSEASTVTSSQPPKKRSVGRSVSFDDDVRTVELPRWDDETKKALFYDSVDLRGFKVTEKARQERKASEKIAKQMNSTIGAATVGMPSFFDGL